jgi:hypothetical protein
MLLTTLAFARSAEALATPSLTPLEQLGKFLFFDQNLSKNGNQSCATCHDPSVGYTGPDSSINAHGAVYPGSDPALFGNRKPPSAAYAGDSTLLRYDPSTQSWIGGMFWDGRATGDVLGDRWRSKRRRSQPVGTGSLPQELCNKSLVGLTPCSSSLAGSLDCTNAAVVYDQITCCRHERSWRQSPAFDKFWDRRKPSVWMSRR